MEILIYLFIFIMGTFFGSFFTLAVYRIPLGEDITHKHSFCPNCKHKLGILDLFPIWSYIFLGGKCRYCHTKIRPRYLLLEILSGLVFLLLALSLRFSFTTLEIDKLVYFAMSACYISTIFIIAGIEKEKHYVQKGVLLFGIVLNALYMIYLSIVEKTNIDRYVIYLFLFCAALLVDTLYLKKKGKLNYPIQIINLCLYTVLFTGEYVFITTVIFLLLTIPFSNGYYKWKNARKKCKRNDTQQMENYAFAFHFAIVNILVWLANNWYIMYR